MKPGTTPTTVKSGQSEPAVVTKSCFPYTWLMIQFSRSRPWQAEQSPYAAGGLITHCPATAATTATTIP